MSTSTGRPPAEQEAWADGYNTALELAAKRLREMMMADGPSTDEINAALGLSLPSQQGKNPSQENQS